MAASFFMLRSFRCNLHCLEVRVKDLEYSSLCEAYRQAGYKIDCSDDGKVCRCAKAQQ